MNMEFMYCFSVSLKYMIYDKWPHLMSQTAYQQTGYKVKYQDAALI